MVKGIATDLENETSEEDSEESSLSEDESASSDEEEDPPSDDEEGDRIIRSLAQLSSAEFIELYRIVQSRNQVVPATATKVETPQVTRQTAARATKYRRW